MNGVSGVGVGAGGIPGEIVGVEPAPAQDTRDRRGETVLPSVLPMMPGPRMPTPVGEPLPVVKSLPTVIRETGNQRVATPTVSL